MRKLLLWAARRYADRVICVSQAVRQKMFDGEGFAGDQVRVIYDGGPDLSRFDPGRARANLRAEFCIPEDAFVVGMVSKFARVKGHDHFLEAAAQLRAQVKEDHLYFVLVGGPLPGHEEYYREASENMFRQALQASYEDPQDARTINFRILAADRLKLKKEVSAHLEEALTTHVTSQKYFRRWYELARKYQLPADRLLTSLELFLESSAGDPEFAEEHLELLVETGDSRYVPRQLPVLSSTPGS